MSIRTTRHVACLALACGLALLAGGCIPWFEKKDEADQTAENLGMISIHPYYPQGTSDEPSLVLYHISGKQVHVGIEPVLTSTLMDHIEIIPTERGNALKILLSLRGRNLWAEATSRYFGRHMALVVDENFRALIHIPKASDTGVFMLTGPFTDAEAKRMADYVNNRDE